ncbi:MAG: hypothetical protein ACXV45_07840 [Halobacteriota archaeon]
MTRRLLVTSILIIVIASMLIAGCTSTTNTTSPTAASTTPTATASTARNATRSTPIPPTPAKIATTIHVWEGYMGQPAFWLDYPQYHVALQQGSSEMVRYWIDAADGKHPCGAANYYIDNYAAGGKWDITKPNPQYWEGCPEGLPGGAGGLSLYAEDTMKLSPGWHTLKIDYLGDNTYAPSEFTSQFLVVAAGQPTPTPTI